VKEDLVEDQKGMETVEVDEEEEAQATRLLGSQHCG
jgi:hypothetical protein